MEIHKSTELDESAIVDSLRAHLIERLVSLLPESGLEGETLDRFLGLVRRSSHLVFRYPSQKEESRDVFLKALRLTFKQRYDAIAQGKLDEELRLLSSLETGYRDILALLARTEIGKNPRAVQAAAALGRLAEQAEQLTHKISEAIAHQTEFTISDEIRLREADGSEYSADAAVDGLLQGLRITLIMLGHQAKWFGSSEELVLPPLPEVGDQERFQSGSTELLAASWRNWEDIDGRCRFLGGTLDQLSGDMLPDGTPGPYTTILRHVPGEEEVTDWIANERAAEAELQDFGEIFVETKAAGQAIGIANHGRLLPEQFVSLAELHSGSYLATILGMDLLQDTRVWGGLRVVEWLRGYSVLRELANDALENGTTSFERHLSSWSRENLRSVLERLGLSSAAAAAFIEAATLSIKSQDLFDSPLIQQSDGSVFLIGLAAKDVLPAKVVLSRLRSLDHHFSSKGPSFERSVLNLFREKGFDPYSIKTKRNGEEYEIDVLVPWGDYLFVFECKNRSLSAHHPVQAYHFVQDRNSFIKQAKRQVAGLLAYPDISLAAGGPDPRTKTIIPCILYSLPYAVAGAIDGVHVTDWSGLGRFFKERYVHLKLAHHLRGDDRLVHRTAVYSFWEGSEPTEADLLRHIKDPFQVRAMAARLAPWQHSFILREDCLGVATRFRREPATVELFAELCGFDAGEARLVQRKVERVAARVRSKSKTRERNEQLRQERLQVRRWREDQRRGPRN